MKIALCSDVHGDIASLSQAYDFAQKNQAQLYVLGDIIENGCTEAENRCLAMVREAKSPAVRGNHEDHMLDIRNRLELRVPSYVHTINRQNADFVSSLPYALKAERACFSHNLPVREIAKPKNCSSARRILRGVRAQGFHIAFCGHNHSPVCFLMRQGGVSEDFSGSITLDSDAVYFITPGSLAEFKTILVYDLDAGIVERRRVA